MANPLTGEHDAVLQVSVGTLNRLMASMHQNERSESALPSLPHSAFDPRRRRPGHPGRRRPRHRPHPNRRPPPSHVPPAGASRARGPGDGPVHGRLRLGALPGVHAGHGASGVHAGGDRWSGRDGHGPRPLGTTEVSVRRRPQPGVVHVGGGHLTRRRHLPPARRVAQDDLRHADRPPDPRGAPGQKDHRPRRPGRQSGHSHRVGARPGPSRHREAASDHEGHHRWQGLRGRGQP